MSLLEFHGRLGNTAMLFALAVGIWALVLYFRQRGPDAAYFGGLVIGELLFITQGVLGAILYFSGQPLGQWVHILYGVVGVFTLPAAYAYTQGGSTRRESLVYGLVGLFLFGVALRAITTAR
jgi:uncharacterized protein YybS (DUF2232 family)